MAQYSQVTVFSRRLWGHAVNAASQSDYRSAYYLCLHCLTFS